MENEEIITLTKCDNSIVADEIVSKLAGNGIIASLHDELNDPAYGAYGPNPGIEVRVFKKDYEPSKIKVLRSKEGKRSTLAILLGIVLIILSCAGLILPSFVEALASIRLYGYIISPFVLLGGVLLVLPKQDYKYYQCIECGKVFKK